MNSCNVGFLSIFHEFKFIPIFNAHALRLPTEVHIFIYIVTNIYNKTKVKIGKRVENRF